MPYQLVFNTRQRTLTQVVLVTAGEDQVHICTPTIGLQGEVLGDLTGHTVEWEQIDGTLVILMDGNTLTPSFSGDDNTDKTFRLWIDRGTPFEQFDDVRILKTPTSFPIGSFNNDNQFLTYPLDPPPVACNDITASVEVEIPPPTSSHGEEIGSTINIFIDWLHPGNSETDEHIEQYRVVENNVDVGFFPLTPISNAGDRPGGGPPSGTLRYTGMLAEYRIDTYYNIGGFDYYRPSCTKDFTNLVIPLVVGYNDAIDGTSHHPDNNFLNVENFGYIKMNQEDPSINSFNNDNHFLNVVNYGYIAEEVEDLSISSFINDNHFINIERFGQTGIGGG